MSKRGWHKSTGDDKRTKSSSLGLQGSRTVRKAENEAKNTIVKNLDSQSGKDCIWQTLRWYRGLRIATGKNTMRCFMELKLAVVWRIYQKGCSSTYIEKWNLRKLSGTCRIRFGAAVHWILLTISQLEKKFFFKKAWPCIHSHSLATAVFTHRTQKRF